MRHLGISLALGAGLALLTACERTEDGRTEDGRGEPAPSATPQPEPGASGKPAAAAPERVQPIVLVLAVGVDCAPTAVPFEHGAARLDDGDRVALNALAQCLKAAPDGEPLSVAAVPARADAESYDEALASQRATNVVSFLRISGVSETPFEIRPVGADGAVATMPVIYPAHPTARTATRDPTPGGEPTQRSAAKPGAE